MKRKPLSEAHKASIRKKLKGRIFTENHRKNLRLAAVGKIRSKTHCENLSKALIGRVIDEEWRNNMSKSRKGVKFTEEHKSNIRKSLTGLIRGPQQQWHKDKISKANTGHVVTKETRNSISKSNKGRVVSQESRVKTSKTLKGRPSPNKGKFMNCPSPRKSKTYEEVYGIDRAKKIKDKIVASKIGKVSKLKGKTYEEICGEENGRARKSKLLGHDVSESTRQKIRLKRLKQIFPFKDTSIEVKLQNKIRENNIDFKTHVPIFGQPDIFIDPNICIFADGDYWHRLPNALKRDALVNDRLTRERYIILRFWEHEINDDINGCFSKIRKAIEDKISAIK